MRSQTIEIRQVGALLTVHVGIVAARRKALIKSGGIIPPLMPIELLVDTGASCTMLDTSVMRSLGLEATSASEYTSASTQGIARPCDVYDIELIIGGQANAMTWRLGALQVITDAFLNEPFHGLLGRDVLNQAQLEYNGRARRCTLTYE
ncbi:retropepsin-like aspartic protease [Methylibium petroleiphilum]